nr:MAG TPA: hypothetical protein [Caudoviricetes sp.]
MNYGAALNYTSYISARFVCFSHRDIKGAILAPWRYIHIPRLAGR